MPRTERIGTTAASRLRTRVASCTSLLLMLALPVHSQQAAASGTSDRIKAAGKVRLGYLTEASPFAYRDKSGAPQGFAVALCQKAADGIKADLGVPNLAVEWVTVDKGEGMSAVQQGKVDLLCGTENITLGKMQQVTFSLPIFPGGIGALLRKDSQERLREILSGRPLQSPVWRASAGQLLQTQTLAVVKGTTAQPWLAGKLKEFLLTAKVVTADDYADAVKEVVDRKANVVFGDRATLLDAARNRSANDLVVLDRFFTYESLALAMAKGDDRFQLAVNRALSRYYATAEFRALYVKWFGEPDNVVLTFYRWNALPE